MGIVLVLLLLFASHVAAQQVPPPQRWTDGTINCRPANVINVTPGFLSCPASGEAQLNMGATPPPTIAFNNITTGTLNTAQSLIVGSLATLRPTGTGVIEASEMSAAGLRSGIVPTGQTVTFGSGAGLTTSGTGTIKATSLTPSGTAGVCVEWGAGGTLVDAASGLACGAGAGGSNDFAALLPGTNTNSGTFEFSGTANFSVTSQQRIPASTSPAAVDRELKIDTDGDGTAVNKPQLMFQSAGTNFYIPAPAAAPTANNQVPTYSATGNEIVWAVPQTGTNNPGGAANSIQTNDGAGGFRGSTKWSIDPANGDALTGTCDRGTLGNCTNEFTSESGTVGAPAAANRVASYFKQTGSVYDMCWNGSGDTGERCAGQGAGTKAKRTVMWDMAVLSNDGASADTNWDFDTGTTTPFPETTNAIKYASLGFAQAGTTCVQRKIGFDGQSSLVAGSLDAGLRWKSSATSGSVTFTLALACWNADVAESAVTFNTPTAPGADTTAGPNQRNGITFADLDLTGCVASSVAFFRLCQTANDLVGGDQIARVISFVYELDQQ